MSTLGNDSPTKPVIVLGITGSIAAYKGAELASKLTQAGCDVHAVMTGHATEFVTPLTFQTLTRNPVTTNLFDEGDSWHPTHIDLADRAALVLVAPATAHTIARLSLGLADDALTAIALATRSPILIAPAMNGHMWLNPVTQEHVDRLTRRGVEWIGPADGLLACGYEGAGRMTDPAKIVAKALKIVQRE